MERCGANAGALYLLIAVARDAVDVAHVATHDDCGGRRAEGNGYFAAAEYADSYNAAACGSHQQHAGIGA
jgi:hypothetical protein